MSWMGPVSLALVEQWYNKFVRERKDDTFLEDLCVDGKKIQN